MEIGGTWKTQEDMLHAERKGKDYLEEKVNPTGITKISLINELYAMSQNIGVGMGLTVNMVKTFTVGVVLVQIQRVTNKKKSPIIQQV